MARFRPRSQTTNATVASTPTALPHIPAVEQERQAVDGIERGNAHVQDRQDQRLHHPADDTGLAPFGEEHPVQDRFQNHEHRQDHERQRFAGLVRCFGGDD